MSHPHSEIIVYGYEMAPNPQKLFQFLAFFNIPYKYVEIPVIMPRPQFKAIGITYRRSPLLSINSDMYVDNALIISRLSDIAQHSADTGLTDATNHLEFDALGQQAFRLGVMLTHPDTPFLHDKAFLADRSELVGATFNPEDLARGRPMFLSQMISLVRLIEGHFLKGERKFILDGETPTTADMHLYWGLNWGLRYHQGTRPEISPETQPRIFKWLEDVGDFIKNRKRETEITFDQAYEVLKVPPTHEYAKFVTHVDNNQEGLSQGQKIKVTPVDSGRSGPQFGTLLSLNYEQVCLRNEKDLVMHFPRTGYEIASAGT